MKKHILTFHESTPIDPDSLYWYESAHEIARSLSETYDVQNVEKICGVISALSPSVNWDKNIVDAKNVIQSYANGLGLDSVTVSTYNQNKVKAFSILNSSLSPLTHFRKDTKTESFYMNMAEPTNPSFVTIDRHALRIALGRHSLNVNGITVAKYRECTLAYLSAFKTLKGSNYTVANQLQAATWAALRTLKGY